MGDLTAEFDGADLRYVSFGGLEVVRRVYVAVRDHNWDTIPGEIRVLRTNEDAFGVEVEFDASHRTGTIDFAWRGTIAMSAENTLTFTMDGVADGAFSYNRIGICVLHPPNVAGCPFRARAGSGEIRGELPQDIGPQMKVDGRAQPLFDSYSALDLEHGNVVMQFAFEGELFEMEDQRNWTDASFKTYSTPLALGFPHHATAGQRIRQSLVVALDGDPQPRPASTTPRIVIGDRLGRSLPSLGLGVASHGHELGDWPLEQLRPLSLDHLRVDLLLDMADWQAVLARASSESRALGAGLELAIHIGDDDTALSQLAQQLASETARVEIERVLVFRSGESSTPGDSVQLAREALAGLTGDASFVGGTNAYFTDLNRDRPDAADVDAVAFSINPQVHATDEASLVETCAAQAGVVHSARRLFDGRPIIVSPVTLRPRFNPNATGAEPESGADELPTQVDTRQCSLFGAAWTLGSAKYLAEAGAASVTYYETSGWRGILEDDEGSPQPERFLSLPRTVFPLYHVLADLCEWRDGELVATVSSNPLVCEGMAVRRADVLHVLVANMTVERQALVLEGLRDGPVSVRTLDSESAATALASPAHFRASAEQREVENGVLVLDLAPCATVRIDCAQSVRE